MSWFEIIHVNEYLYVIRERLDKIEPKFQTEYTNLFLILGTDEALLIDTGCGVELLFPKIKNLIGSRKLNVLNTHHHFDHVLGNNEYPEIFIHTKDALHVSKPIDITYLEYRCDNFVRHNWIIPSANQINKLQGNEKFDLGGISCQIIHTPGHTQGSICVLTDKGDLFTGDTYHLGTMYLPGREQITTFYETIKFLTDLNHVQHVYPAHEKYQVTINDIKQFLDFLVNYYPYDLLDPNIDLERVKGELDPFLGSHVIVGDEYSLVYPRDN